MEKQNRYSIRKLTVGAASVLIGVSLFGIQSQVAHADTVNDAQTVANQTGQGKVIKQTDTKSGNLQDSKSGSVVPSETQSLTASPASETETGQTENNPAKNNNAVAQTTQEQSPKNNDVEHNVTNQEMQTNALQVNKNKTVSPEVDQNSVSALARASFVAQNKQMTVITNFTDSDTGKILKTVNNTVTYGNSLTLSEADLPDGYSILHSDLDKLTLKYDASIDNTNDTYTYTVGLVPTKRNLSLNANITYNFQYADENSPKPDNDLYVIDQAKKGQKYADSFTVNFKVNYVATYDTDTDKTTFSDVTVDYGDKLPDHIDSITCQNGELDVSTYYLASLNNFKWRAGVAIADTYKNTSMYKYDGYQSKIIDFNKPGDGYTQVEDYNDNIFSYYYKVPTQVTVQAKDFDDSNKIVSQQPLTAVYYYDSPITVDTSKLQLQDNYALKKADRTLTLTPIDDNNNLKVSTGSPSYTGVTNEMVYLYTVTLDAYQLKRNLSYTANETYNFQYADENSPKPDNDLYIVDQAKKGQKYADSFTVNFKINYVATYDPDTDTTSFSDFVIDYGNKLPDHVDSITYQDGNIVTSTGQYTIKLNNSKWRAGSVIDKHHYGNNNESIYRATNQYGFGGYRETIYNVNRGGSGYLHKLDYHSDMTFYYYKVPIQVTVQAKDVDDSNKVVSQQPITAVYYYDSPITVDTSKLQLQDNYALKKADRTLTLTPIDDNNNLKVSTGSPSYTGVTNEMVYLYTVTLDAYQLKRNLSYTANETYNFQYADENSPKPDNDLYIVDQAKKGQKYADSFTVNFKINYVATYDPDTDTTSFSDFVIDYGNKLPDHVDSITYQDGNIVTSTGQYTIKLNNSKWRAGSVIDKHHYGNNNESIYRATNQYGFGGYRETIYNVNRGGSGYLHNLDYHSDMTFYYYKRPIQITIQADDIDDQTKIVSLQPITVTYYYDSPVTVDMSKLQLKDNYILSEAHQNLVLTPNNDNTVVTSSFGRWTGRQTNDDMVLLHTLLIDADHKIATYTFETLPDNISNVAKTDLQSVARRTIVFHLPASYLANNPNAIQQILQEIDYSRSVNIDLVTNKLVKYNDWQIDKLIGATKTANGANFDAVKIPHVPGYKATIRKVNGLPTPALFQLFSVSFMALPTGSTNFGVSEISETPVAKPDKHDESVKPGTTTDGSKPVKTPETDPVDQKDIGNVIKDAGGDQSGQSGQDQNEQKPAKPNDNKNGSSASDSNKDSEHQNSQSQTDNKSAEASGKTNTDGRNAQNEHKKANANGSKCKHNRQKIATVTRKANHKSVSQGSMRMNQHPAGTLVAPEKAKALGDTNMANDHNVKAKNAEANTLPQTGEKKSSLGLIGLAFASLSGILGFGVKKRKND